MESFWKTFCLRHLKLQRRKNTGNIKHSTGKAAMNGIALAISRVWLSFFEAFRVAHLFFAALERASRPHVPKQCHVPSAVDPIWITPFVSVPEILCPAWPPCTAQVFFAVILLEKLNLCFVTCPVRTLPAPQAGLVLLNVVQSLLSRDLRAQNAMSLYLLWVLIWTTVLHDPSNSDLEWHHCATGNPFRTLINLDQVFNLIIRFWIW